MPDPSFRYAQYYLPALLIIALMSTSATYSLNRVLESERKNAAPINLSGKQRMLSQRIAYYALRLVTTQEASKRDTIRRQLRKLSQLMIFHHYSLRDGNDSLNIPPRSPEARVEAVSPQQDMRLDSFLSQVAVLCQIPDQQLSDTAAAARYIFQVNESASLLNSLDRSVSAYEHYAQDQLRKIQRQEYFILALTLLVLLLEGLFIFQPMVKKIQRQHRQLGEQLHDLSFKNRELKQFFYVASHDLQEPLRTVQSFANLLAQTQQEALDQQGRHLLDRMLKATARMQGLIADLLSYARLGHQSELKPVDSAQIVDNLVADLDQALVDSGGQIERGPLPQLWVYPLEFEALLRNLLTNALKYRRPGVPPRIYVEAQPLQGKEGWQFAVHDNGIGIDPQYHEQIFGIFQRLHGREQYQGTGIGLAICQKVAELHQGRIWLESIPQEGSSFFFTIQLPQSHAYPHSS